MELKLYICILLAQRVAQIIAQIVV